METGIDTGTQRSDVGPGRPPLEHQWRPGQSGNPRGRPRGSKSLKTLIRELGLDLAPVIDKLDRDLKRATKRIARDLEPVTGEPVELPE